MLLSNLYFDTHFQPLFIFFNKQLNVCNITLCVWRKTHGLDFFTSLYKSGVLGVYLTRTCYSDKGNVGHGYEELFQVCGNINAIYTALWDINQTTCTVINHDRITTCKWCHISLLLRFLLALNNLYILFHMRHIF